MAIPVNIQELLDAGVVESTRIEYREGFNPAAILRTICAFANDIDNTGGGYILIGVREEKGRPILPRSTEYSGNFRSTVIILNPFMNL